MPPLAVPAAEDDHFWRCGAAWLFVLRSRASGAHIPEDRHVAILIATICRRLDGIPLAIELAAARGGALGIEEVANGLDDRFRLLTGGRRTALPRHQTLRATLDWSYELLSEPERLILRRIAIFAGAFRLETACAVVASPELPQQEVVDGFANLAAKSLVGAEVDSGVARYRLLDTTRAYAAEKLDASGERERIARRHAEYYLEVFERAEAEWRTRPTDEWAADYARRIDNVRPALDWAFSPAGDGSIGVALTAAAVPLWMHLSLLGECVGRVEAALRTLRDAAAVGPDAEMRLCAALGVSLAYTRGPTGGVEAIWARTLELAEAANDTDYQLRALYGHWVYRVLVCDYRGALRLAQQFGVIARRGAATADIAVADRLVGLALHYLGDQAEARACMIRCLSVPAPANRMLQPTHYGLDQRVGAYVMLARALWLQGFPGQAIAAARAGMDEADLVGHANSICVAIADGAGLIAVLAEDVAEIERLAALLIQHAENRLLGVWRIYGNALRGRLLMHHGAAGSGAALLRTALRELRETPLDIRYQLYLVWYAETLAAAGNPLEALTAIDEALQRAERTEERWYLPELLRLRGEFLRSVGQPDTSEAAGHFRQALDWARRQGALSLELRAAMSLARLLRDQGRPADAMAILRAVYARFTEGFETTDLKAAQALLNALR